MDRFDRQARIPGWNQARLQEGSVVVCGRDWLGTFVVWALSLLGIGEIHWIGKRCPRTEAWERWLLREFCPSAETGIHDYPFDIEYGPELALPFGYSQIEVLVCTSENAFVQSVCVKYASEHNVKFLTATTRGGGWFGPRTDACPVQSELNGQQPITAMILGAIVADSVRESILPLSGGLITQEGPLGLFLPVPERLGKVLLIGVGGIGVYVATLAALHGYDVVLIDSDQVETSNLNRQGLFSAMDAQRNLNKAVAAMTSLKHLFPRSNISAQPLNVDPRSLPRLEALRPSLVLSAVDNAKTRILLQSLASRIGAPLIHGGTDVFAADCYTQEAGGPTLDEQMFGALSSAAKKESRRQSGGGGCVVDPSYVVPGMLAGAMMAYRMVQVSELYRGLLPMRWRSGSLPMEQRSIADDFKIQ